MITKAGLQRMQEIAGVEYTVFNADETTDSATKTINKLVAAAHGNALAKGFWDEPREVGTLLMLIVSEAAEALEADRKGDKANFAEEIADICIRIFDLCGGLGIDLEGEIRAKMAKNQSRGRLHGKNY